MKSFHRTQFCIEIDMNLFDLFFNSQNGYRAQYFSSPFDGLKANRRTVEVLERRLLATVDCGEKGFAQDSLSADSAKIWLAEKGNHICDKCEGEWSETNGSLIDIRNGRWEKVISPGRTAPTGTKLRIMGGFLNDQRDEWIPSRKRFRSRQICEQGWS